MLYSQSSQKKKLEKQYRPCQGVSGYMQGPECFPMIHQTPMVL